MDMSRDDELMSGLIAAISRGLPMVSRPYAALAEELKCSEQAVLDGIARLAARGDLKRFGVVVRHRQLGYRANAMVVWDVPDARVAEAGTRMSDFDFVTLCYQRPRRLPHWPYNLFCMIHGRDRDSVNAQVDLVAARCGLTEVPRKILYSRRCFKQRGATYQRKPPVTATENLSIHG